MERDKIEVGEYIRTIYGEIFRVFRTTKQNKKYIFVDREVDRNQDRDANDSVLEIKEIKKHSKNIIDLIEVGDIVTYWLGAGYYTTRTVDVEFLKQIKDTFINKDIRSIVTKEQFKEMEYRV